MKGDMRIHYDKEGDYLAVFIGPPRPNYGEDISKGTTIFKDKETGEVVGIGILDFLKRSQSLDEIKVNLPFTILGAKENEVGEN
jgi:hypothetical protein